MSAKIGFVGLGLMGTAMVDRLLEKGFRVAVWNRTKEKSDPVLSRGATWSPSVRELAASSDIVVSMLSTPDVVTKIAGDIRGGLQRGGIHVDCSTISPRSTSELANAYGNEGKGFVHAPVLGSVSQSAEGSLIIFAGGSSVEIGHIRPLLEALAKKIFVFPRVEDATTMKLLCNFFIASMIGTLSQGIAGARKAGLDPRVLLEVLSLSALNAPMYQSKGAAMISGEFTPRFFLEHALKDVRLVDEATSDLGASMPFIRPLRKMFEEGMEKGYGKLDYSAVLKVLEQEKGIS